MDEPVRCDWCAELTWHPYRLNPRTRVCEVCAPVDQLYDEDRPGDDPMYDRLVNAYLLRGSLWPTGGR